MVIQWLKLPHCTSMSSTSQLGCFFSLSDRDIQSVQILVEYTMPSRYTLMQSIYLRSGSLHTYCVRVCQSDLFYAYIDIYGCVCETNSDMLSIQIHIWHLGKILATHIKHIMICIYMYIHTYVTYYTYYTSSTAQGGGGSFKNWKPIGEIGCCESGMAERIHWWTERCLRSPLFLSLSLTIYPPTNLYSMYLSIYLSIHLSIFLIYLSFFLSNPSIYLSVYLSIYPSIYLSISI